MCLLFTGQSVFSQKSTTGKETDKFSISMGTGFVAPNFRLTSKTSRLAWQMKANMRLNERFQLGLFAGNAQFKTVDFLENRVDDVPDKTQTYQVLGIRFEGTIHSTDRLKFYGGALIYHMKHTIDKVELSDRPHEAIERKMVLFGGTMGARYFVHEKIGVYAEFTTSATIVNTGVSFHF